MKKLPMLLASMLALGGCTPRDVGPYDADAQLRPDLVRLEPASTGPGTWVRLSFPEGSERGIGWVLEEQVGDDWQLRYFLTAATPQYGNGAAPAWRPADAAEGVGWDAVLISGPGSDTLVIPAPATPGAYRLCTANASPNICTPLTITSAPPAPR